MEDLPPLGSCEVRFRVFSPDETAYEDTFAMLLDEDSRDSYATGPGIAANTDNGRVLVTVRGGAMPVMLGWTVYTIADVEGEDPPVFTEASELLHAGNSFEKNFPMTTPPPTGSSASQEAFRVYRAF